MYYVSMTDKFMFGWGCADNKINKLIIACDTFEEAQIVERNAKRRHEMRYVNLCINKPYYNQRYYYINYHDKSSYGNWFINHLDWE